MEGTSLGAEFQHEPLPDSTSHIRLLEILRVDSEDRIVCRLTAWPINDAPKYYALSYTWGESNSSSLVIINEGVFAAGANCIYALQQAYASEASEFFWVDALCIDQKSTQEKNHQVAMMGQIYARAVHVFACVGPHTDSSKSLFEIIDKNRPFFTSIHALTHEPSIGSTRYWVISNPILKTSWLALRCFFAMNARTRQSLASAFIAFMERPYFSRVWVLQELHLASKISLCCGMDIRSFDYLLAVSMLVDFWINQGSYVYALRGIAWAVVSVLSRQSWIMRRQTSCISLQDDIHDIRPQSGCLALASGVRGRRRLAEVLEAMQHFQCTDIRDRLFGILALVDWRGGPVPEPDYGKDSYEVAVMVLNLYLENAAHAPISGMVVEWPRRLCEIFEIRLGRGAMCKAIGERYYDRQIPSQISLTCAYIDSRSTRRLSSYTDERKTYIQMPDTTERDLRGHPRDTWYGVRLRNIRDVGQSSTILQSNYLCCAAHSSKHAIHPRRPPVGIVDQKGSLFAHAPDTTRPTDWLLISEGGSLSEQDAMMVVVRVSDPDSGIYTIIGQACMNHEYGENIVPFLDWEYFGSRWHTEDLFLLDWAYVNRASCIQTTETIADWLWINICARGGSSCFFGPSTQPRIEYDLGGKTPHYNRKSVDLIDFDPDNFSISRSQLLGIELGGLFFSDDEDL